ncbi:MAG TPA: helicase-related protein [Bacteriovoracaceae bacterium]|nr:helicase-related protein [Bacteriovoracaceae bacterium]
MISPLRALRDECLEKWEKEISVMTPEEWRLKKIYSPIVIFDEAHLNFYWGDTFRQSMWEVFYEVSCNSELVIFLTATLTEGMLEEIGLMDHFQQKLWINCGNQQLKNVPARYVKAPSKSYLLNLLEQDEFSAGCTLVFCAFRQEVAAVAVKLEARGKRVLTCVGGEASEFSRRLAVAQEPQFIVATTVLSHGVNLPSIARIIFLYEVCNKDFWIQMVARGGRRGEEYEVLALEKPHGLKWNPVSNFLRVLWISLKINLRRELEPKWFLKD